MNNYEIQEASRKLIDKGFSVNASAAILMWSKYHNNLKSPFFFKNSLDIEIGIDEAIDMLDSRISGMWDDYGVRELSYTGGLELPNGISVNRFKTGFIDVLTLSQIFEVCYGGYIHE